VERKYGRKNKRKGKEKQKGKGNKTERNGFPVEMAQQYGPDPLAAQKHLVPWAVVEPPYGNL